MSVKRLIFSTYFDDTKYIYPDSSLYGIFKLCNEKESIEDWCAEIADIDSDHMEIVAYYDQHWKFRVKYRTLQGGARTDYFDLSEYAPNSPIGKIGK
jgi:hypothetical protein